MSKKVLLLAATGLAALGIGVPTAGAHSTVAFLCYSKYEVDPGVWSLAITGPRDHETAAELMALGYWAPFAEKTIPTQTQIANGYYLICNLPTGVTPTAGMIVTQKGVVRPADSWALTHPGYYPEA